LADSVIFAPELRTADVRGAARRTVADGDAEARFAARLAVEERSDAGDLLIHEGLLGKSIGDTLAKGSRDVKRKTKCQRVGGIAKTALIAYNNPVNLPPL
jgi:hypothetical protein